MTRVVRLAPACRVKGGAIQLHPIPVDGHHGGHERTQVGVAQVQPVGHDSAPGLLISIRSSPSTTCHRNCSRPAPSGG